MPRVMVDSPSIGSNDGLMLCRYGCPLPVYPMFGCCYGCLDGEEPKGAPWVKCLGCRRAMDVILGDAATDEDRLCKECMEKRS